MSEDVEKQFEVIVRDTIQKLNNVNCSVPEYRSAIESMSEELEIILDVTRPEGLQRSDW